MKNSHIESETFYLFCLCFQPPTEKVHQIIARTAMFVSKHGGQSEIVLRVKQGDNPTFGFLMPDHHLHAYFRFLVDHQELLKPDSGDKSLVEKNNAGLDQAGSALSILGSVYGSGEDEDGATEEIPEYKRNDLEEAVNAGNVTVSHGSVQAVSSVNVAGKDVAIAKGSVMSLKEKAPIIKRNRSISTVMVGTRSGVRKEADALGSLCTAGDKSQASLLSTPKVEQPIVEPPSDLKRVVDKIVEFILKNGKQFEAVLVEQDQKHGRFPFLLSSNQYHPYYLKALEKAKELKLPGKGSDSMGHQVEKKTAVPKEGDTLSRGSADLDIPYSYDRKEKFKMFIGKSKKDGQDPPSKATEPQIGISMDAASAAAILQAATRGIKNPSLENFPMTSLNGIGRGPSSDGGHTSSFGSLRSSQHQSSISKPDQKGEPSVSVPVAKAIAETAAIAAASEADSSEACLTREQKLKAERLKRAKMFAVMIKSGAAPLKTEPLRGLSAEPLGSGISGSGTEVENFVGKEREGSSVPIDVDDKIEKSEKKISVDEYNERRSKRSYRSRSKRHEEQEEGEVEEDKEEEIEEEQEGEDKRAHKHTRKKHRSHRSSHHSRERHKHRKRHSSKDRDSRHRRKYDDSSDDEHQYSRHRDEHDTPSNNEHRRSQHRRHRDERDSSDDEHQHSRHRDEDDTLSNNEHQRSQHQRKHDSSSDDQHQHSRRRKHHSSDDEHDHRSRSVRHRKSQSDKEMDLEEGEIVTKSDQSKASQGDVASREASVELSKSYQDGGAPSQPSEATEISDDLRAKIRAMLMATL